MTALSATAKDLLERTRRLAGNCEPPRLARLAILSYVESLKQQSDAVNVEPQSIGWLWQAMNEPALQRAFAAAGKGKRKFSAAEIPAVTQLFTPGFVVDFLLHTTLGRAWRERHPDTRLVEKYEGGMRKNEEENSAHCSSLPEPRRPRCDWKIKDLRLIDPACGTMNFGLGAIDLFREMYREEFDRAGDPGWPADPSVRSEVEIDDAILRHNLFGAELDSFTLELARHALELKIGRPLETASLNFFRGDALLDSGLDRRWPGGFDVVVTNPPYLSARNVSPELLSGWKREYPLAARDAYACFIDRSLRLLRPCGRAGLLTMQSFMFTGSYEPLRKSIADRSAIERIAHFGPGLFDVGNPGTLQTVAFVLREEANASARAEQNVRALRLIDCDDKFEALSAPCCMGYRPMPGDESSGATGHGLVAHATPEFNLTQRELSQAPRGAWIYWLSDRERKVLATFPKLQQIAPPRQGLATTDNAQFVRAWWEIEAFSPQPAMVATAGRWFPYVKAGQNRRWHESPRHRVNWEGDGAEIKANIVRKYPYLKGKWDWVAKNSDFYGRAGVTYSYLTSGRFSAREMTAGSIFDVAGSSLFPDDPLLALAVLNSSVARRLLAAINPTVNFQVGDLAELPMLTSAPDSLRQNAGRLIELHRQVDQFDETAPEFVSPMNWESADEEWATIADEIDQLEREADEEVAGLYDLPIDAAPADRGRLDREELARRWVSFALRDAMGELEWATIEAALAHRVRHALERSGGAAAAKIEETIGGIESFLQGPFAAWHNRLYRMRPRWWIFGDREHRVLVAHDRADRATLASALRRSKQSPPKKWNRFIDDGIAVNLAPLREMVSDRNLQRALSEIAQSADAGKLSWSRTYGRRKGVQSRIELRMRSISDKLVARAALPVSSEQVNSAPTRNIPPLPGRQWMTVQSMPVGG